MTEVRSQPCIACPYRQDVPSGVWAWHEYEQLAEYDRPTGEQPFGPFMCHATPEHFCHGWAVCHSNRGHPYELLALRLYTSLFAGLSAEVEIPEAGVSLFASGAEAAAHGQADIARPSAKARAMVERLMRKYDRLRDS